MLTKNFQEVKVEPPMNEYSRYTLSRDGKVRFKEISNKTKRLGYENSLVYFGEPHNKAAILNEFSALRVFSFPGIVFEGKRKFSKDQVNTVLCVKKWNNESFVFGSLTGWVLRVSIIPPYKTIQSIKLEDQVYQSAKMNEKYLLCRRFDSIISLIDIPNNRLIREMKVGKYNSLCTMIPSKRFLNCFYTNTHDNGKMGAPIKLFNYEEVKLVKEFRRHNKNCDNYSVRDFVIMENSKKQEILVVCFVDHFYFYNSSTFKEGEYINSARYRKYEISKCFSIGNKYVFATVLFKKIKKKAKICVFEVGNMNVKIVGETKDQDFRTRFQCFPILEENSSMKIVSFCNKDVKYYTHFKQYEVEGMMFQDGNEYEDLEERILFLRDNFDSFVFSKMERKNLLFQVRFVSGRSFEKCFRILFV